MHQLLKYSVVLLLNSIKSSNTFWCQRNIRRHYSTGPSGANGGKSKLGKCHDFDPQKQSPKWFWSEPRACGSDQVLDFSRFWPPKLRSKTDSGRCHKMWHRSESALHQNTHLFWTCDPTSTYKTYENYSPPLIQICDSIKFLPQLEVLNWIHLRQINHIGKHSEVSYHIYSTLIIIKFSQEMNLWLA